MKTYIFRVSGTYGLCIKERLLAGFNEEEKEAYIQDWIDEIDFGELENIESELLEVVPLDSDRSMYLFRIEGFCCLMFKDSDFCGLNSEEIWSNVEATITDDDFGQLEDVEYELYESY